MQTSTLERESLVRALSSLAKTANQRHFPVLTHAMFAPGANTVSIKTTNLDQQTTIALACESTPGAPFLAPCKALLDWAKARPAGAHITLTPGDGKVSATCETAAASFAALAVDDFPALFPDAAAGASRVALPAPRLAAMIEQVRPALSREETRYYLNGIYIHRAPDAPHELTFVATDGYRLAAAREPLPPMPIPSVIAPADFIAGLAGLLKGRKSDCNLTISPKYIAATIDGVTLESVVIDGTFPDWRRVVPGGNTKIAIFDRAALAAIIKPLAAIIKPLAAKKGAPPAVKLRFDNGTLFIESRNDSGAAELDRIDAAWDSGALKIGFDARYLFAMLTSLAPSPDGRIMAAFADASSPALFWPVDGDRRAAFHVVMSRRI